MQGIAWFDYGNAFYTYASFHRSAPWAAGVTPPVEVGTAALTKLKNNFHAGFEVTSSNCRR